MNLPRRTKIIATIGPATSAPAMLEKLVAGGMDIARLNMSHAKHDDVRAIVAALREISTRLARPVAILMDTQGPAIRTGDLPAPLTLTPGATIVLCVRGERCAEHPSVSVQYDGLVEDVSVGDTVLVDNGVIHLKAREKRRNQLYCEVLTPGVLGNRRHINLPGVHVNLPALTPKDLQDIELGIELKVDFFAMSFVRAQDDLVRLRGVLEYRHGTQRIIAKLEDQSGIANLDEIIAEADGIMVARGDLGIECPYEELPGIQRRIVQTCQRLGRPVIVATHMLESMITSPAPTRAEVTDVANAVHEQADAIMLSGETSVGQHPLACLAIMDRIARRTEREPGAGMAAAAMADSDRAVLVRSACRMAEDLKAQALVVFTRTGRMARNAAWFRPRDIPIYAFTDNPVLLPQLVLHWGTLPLLMDFQSGDPAANVEHAIRVLRERGLVTRGGYVVMATEVRAGDELVNTVQMKQVG